MPLAQRTHANSQTASLANGARTANETRGRDTRSGFRAVAGAALVAVAAAFSCVSAPSRAAEPRPSTGGESPEVTVRNVRRVFVYTGPWNR